MAGTVTWVQVITQGNGGPIQIVSPLPGEHIQPLASGGKSTACPSPNLFGVAEITVSTNSWVRIGPTEDDDVQSNGTGGHFFMLADTKEHKGSQLGWVVQIIDSA